MSEIVDRWLSSKTRRREFLNGLGELCGSVIVLFWLGFFCLCIVAMIFPVLKGVSLMGCSHYFFDYIPYILSENLGDLTLLDAWELSANFYVLYLFSLSLRFFFECFRD